MQLIHIQGISICCK